MTAFKDYLNNMMNFQPIDLNAFKNNASKNVETANETTRVLTHNAQSIYQMHAENTQQIVQRYLECIKSCYNNGHPEEAQKAHTNCMQDMMNQNSKNMRETLEVTAKSMLEVFDIWQKRTHEMFSEVNHAHDNMNRATQTTASHMSDTVKNAVNNVAGATVKNQKR